MANSLHNVSNILLIDYNNSSTQFDIFITSMTCLVFLPLLFGNCLAVLVYIKFKDLRSNTTLLISSMALSDLSVGVFYIFGTWLSSQISGAPSRTACNVIFMSKNAVCFTSLFHLLALNCERYMHIAYPFFYSRCFTKRVTWIIIIMIYLTTSIMISIMYLVLMRDMHMSIWCIAYPKNKGVALMVPVILFLLPFCLISIICAAIYTIVNKHLRVIQEQRVVTKSDGNKQEPVKTNKRTVQTIAVILLTFGLTNCPHRISVAFTPFLGLESNQKMEWYVLPVTKLLLMVNSSVNPVIYGLLYPRYKQAYKSILCRCRFRQ